jgi:ribose/xylose/arabinose/galactoside ABC-type transport system permease subunit
MSLVKQGPSFPQVRRAWASVQDIFALLLMLVVIMFVMGSGSALFLISRNLTNLLMDSTTVGMIAVFMTMLIISGGLDLSVASTTALCGVIIGAMQRSAGLWQGVAVALFVGALIGFINGFLVTYLEINPLITTLGMLSIARGLAFVVADGLTIPVIDMTGEQTQAYTTFTQLSEGKLGTIPIPIVFVVGLFLISILVMRYTTYGQAVYVIGDNEKAAYLAGLSVKRYRMMTYILCGLSAAVAGVFLTSRLYAADPRAAPNS